MMVMVTIIITLTTPTLTALTAFYLLGMRVCGVHRA